MRTLSVSRGSARKIIRGNKTEIIDTRDVQQSPKFSDLVTVLTEAVEVEAKQQTIYGCPEFTLFISGVFDSKRGDRVQVKGSFPRRGSSSGQSTFPTAGGKDPLAANERRLA